MAQAQSKSIEARPWLTMLRHLCYSTHTGSLSVLRSNAKTPIIFMCETPRRRGKCQSASFFANNVHHTSKRHFASLWPPLDVTPLVCTLRCIHIGLHVLGTHEIYLHITGSLKSVINGDCIFIRNYNEKIKIQEQIH